MAKSISDRLLVKPGKRVRLKDWDPGDTLGWEEDAARARTAANLDKIADLQRVLAAEAKHGVLLVLQAMDAGGKDGAIRKLAAGLNPQGCSVASFKAPTAEELSHDFLWRIHRVCPARGQVVLFNRSHYEDVLVVRVHELVAKKVWSRRYEQINAFEDLLSRNGTTVRKVFLHISKDEQRTRLQERLTNPEKHWKFNLGDLKDRELWDAYMDAYEAVLERCCTGAAPWYIVPANNKWFRDLVVSEVLLETLVGLDLKFPKPTADLSKVVVP
jgi:PPK2 family polyphosphate:nucleotide phosphotransferase